MLLSSSSFPNSLLTNSMIRLSFFGDNRLSQLSSPIDFSDSSQIHKFCYAFFLKMIVMLELRIQRLKFGSNKTKCSSHGFNRNSLRRFYLVCWDAHTPIRFGSEFMTIFTSKHEPRHVNSELSLSHDSCRQVDVRVLIADSSDL